MKTGDLSVQKTPTATDDAATKAYVDTKGFGTWVDKSASYGAQQAATDGWVVMYGYKSGTLFEVTGLTDAKADPTTVVCGDSGTSGGYAGFTMPVKKNNYWKLIMTTSPTALSVQWVPVGA